MMTQSKSLWRNRDFLTVWGGQSISMFGSRVSYIAWIWWVLEKTDSAASVAAIGIAAALPSLILGPIAGALVDRMDRRKVMLWTDLINVAIFGSAASLLFADMLQVWHVYLFTAAGATSMALHRPALQSSIPNLVPAEQLTHANSLYQISRGVCGIVGLLMGGVLVGLIGVAPTLGLDAVTFLIAGTSLLLVAIASPRTSAIDNWRTVLQDIANGFRFLLNRKSLFYLILLFALINFLLAPIGVLFSLMSRDVFDAGSQGFGALNAAISVGLLVGGFLTAILKKFRKHGLWILIGLIGIGLLLTLLGLSTNLTISLGILAVMGIIVAVVNVFESVIFQTQVPNELQGRVFAAQFTLCDGLQPLSLAVIGSILTVVSTPTVLIGSGIAVILAGLTGFAVKDLVEL
jgi:DHA3 family macrolide efflux protein-like MFS transporter